MLRFHCDDLRKLFEYLRFTNGCITLSNNSKIFSEHLFLFSLHRLAKASTLEDLSSIFGYESTQLSRAFQWFINHILINFSYLIDRSVDQWVDWFPQFAHVVEEKMNSFGVFFNQHQHNGVACFIDTTFCKTCRPSGPKIVQQAFYSRKKGHGIKFQAILFPNGIIGEIYGPISGRRNDRLIVRKSTINKRLSQCQAGRPIHYVCYGDGLYIVKSHIRRRHVGANLSQQQRLQNRTMSRLRIAIEWVFGKMKRLWRIVGSMDNCKIRERGVASVNNIIKVAVFFTNCHTCLYGSLTNSYFNVQPPSLEIYLNIE
jgi:nuclease HARBI1